MKAWRRRCTATGVEVSGGAPEVISVTIDPGDDTLITVVFDQAVTWDGVGNGTLVTEAQPQFWLTQIDAFTIQAQSLAGLTPGNGWSWSSPDSSLSPVPNPAQTGITS